MALHTIILILHVIGAGILIGMAFFSILLVIPRDWSAEKLSRIKFIGRFGGIVSVWQLLTGVYLASSDWDMLHADWLFWTKITVYCIEGTMASLLVGRKLKNSQANASSPRTAFPILANALMIIIIVSIGVMLVEG